MLLNLPDVPLRSGTFDLEDRCLLWSRLKVYPDRLELVGWSLAGRYERGISLDRIDEADHEERRLRLALENGEEVALIVDEAARWANFIAAQRDVHGHD